MQHHLITDAYLLGFLLLVAWAVARSLWKRKHPSPSTAPEPGKQQPPRWRRILRRTAVAIAGAFAVIFLIGAVMLLGLGYYRRQAKHERDKVRVGMTVEQVLPLVQGALGVRAHAILPDNVTDEYLKHYASFSSHDDTYCCFDGPDGKKGGLTAPEAAAAMHRKMSDGYQWIWRYTFTNDTPMHFSFSVTFGADGRVKSVTDVWGWD